MTKLVPLDLLSPWDPYKREVWNIKRPITRWEIRRELSRGKIQPYDDTTWPTRIYHIRRVAYLVQHGWNDPIDLVLSSKDRFPFDDWIVEDGNHRHAAARYLQRTSILATLHGTKNEISRFLNSDRRLRMNHA